MANLIENPVVPNPNPKPPLSPKKFAARRTGVLGKRENSLENPTVHFPA